MIALEHSTDLPFRWRGGNLALDFTNTTAWNIDPTTGKSDLSRSEYERLTRYSRLVEWAEEADVLHERMARQLIAAAEVAPAEAQDALELAIIVRLAIHRVFSAAAQRLPPDRSALATLNALLPGALEKVQVVAIEDGFTWEWIDGEPDLARPLWPVVHSALQLLTSDSMTRVRECAGEGCGWLFLDRSRSGTRRWCAMDDCGTRTRRQRKRGGVDPEHMERAVAAERRRLSRELHDSVSQALYSIALGAQTARTLLDRDPSRVAEPLEYVLTQAERCLAEMRALIFDLRPESLETEGLVAALRRQAAAFTARHQIECFALLEEEPDLPAAAKEALYRIAQEALQNAAKHSGANAVGLRLRFDKDNVTLEIEDNGRGFDPAAQHPGHLGLHSMRERAIQLGGRLDIESNPNSYTRIRVRLPSPS